MGQPTRKIYVLDTSVILHDHNAIEQFEDNDVAIPIQVLEELDQFKVGNDSRNFESRSFIRILDELSKDHLINEWVEIKEFGSGRFKVIMNSDAKKVNAEDVFGSKKNDHKILNSVINLQDENPDAKVILVTKDICLRLKAKSLNVNAEDYLTGKVEDVDTLYSGKTEIENIDANTIDEFFEKDGVDPNVLNLDNPEANHYFILRNCTKSVLAYSNPNNNQLERIEKQQILKINPKNAEQTFAVHALMNPNIKLITLRGVAGTGKTLLAIAAAIQQRKEYQQIYITRPVVPLGNKDIGYLPGDVKSKLDPYMQPIWDNIKFIKSQMSSANGSVKVIDEMIANEKISIAPLAYIRGRTLANIFFIIDEAQNLTPHEVKTIISRAGENTKIVFTGDIHQIDTPYLDAQSNGLSYIIDKVKNNPLFAHITLEKGERSELANLATALL